MKYIEIIKQILEDNNFSQEKMANILGVNQTTISQWLLGKKKPRYDNILDIYLKFGITPNEFFGLEEISRNLSVEK